MKAQFSNSNKFDTDSDSSDDEALLNKANKDSYHSLRHRCLQKCKYCNKMLISRYAVLKHNLSHVSVSLVNQPLFPCRQCLNYYTSPENLAAHISKKHKDVLINSSMSVKLQLVDDLTHNLKTVLGDDSDPSHTELSEDDVGRVSDLNEEFIIPDVVSFENSLKYKVLDKEGLSDSFEELTSDDEEFNNSEHKVKDLNGSVNSFENGMSDNDYNEEMISDSEETGNDIEEISQVKVQNPEIAKILQSMVEKQLVIKCKDDLREVLKVNKQTNSNESILIDELKTDLKEVEKRSSVEKLTQILHASEECKDDFREVLKVNKQTNSNESILIDELKTDLKEVEKRSSVEKLTQILHASEETIFVNNIVEEAKKKHSNEIKNSVINRNNENRTACINTIPNKNESNNTNNTENYEANSSNVVIKEEISNINDCIDIEEHKILQSIVENDAVVKRENDLQDIFNKHDKIGVNNVNMQLIGSKNVMQLFNSNINRRQWNNVENMQLNLKDRRNEERNDLNVKEELLSPKSFKYENSNLEEKEPIHRRLLFEEDLEDTLFKNLPEDCNNVESTCQEIDNNYENANTIDVQDEEADLLYNSKVIHYDTLILPEQCLCRRCGKEFSNRFELLQHEPIHMARKRWKAQFCVFCERYIVGNIVSLRNHKKKIHPKLIIDRNYRTKECNLCGLQYYNYKRHVKSYHEIYKCGKCGNGFQTLKMKNEHECRTETGLTNGTEQIKEQIMSICTICHSLMKVHLQRLRYEVLGYRSNIGEQQTCANCNVKVFETITFSRKFYMQDDVYANHIGQTDSNVIKEFGDCRRNVVANELQTVKSNAKDVMRTVRKHQRKPAMTNEKRLKNIRNRLKILKQIKKY